MSKKLTSPAAFATSTATASISEIEAAIAEKKSNLRWERNVRNCTLDISSGAINGYHTFIAHFDSLYFFCLAHSCAFPGSQHSIT
jgi:hypothetical protein